MNGSLVGVSESPAPGCRERADGNMYSNGFSGYSWASGANNSISGFDLLFDSKRLYNNSANYRGYGFQLRCLSE